MNAEVLGAGFETMSQTTSNSVCLKILIGLQRSHENELCQHKSLWKITGRVLGVATQSTCCIIMMLHSGLRNVHIQLFDNGIGKCKILISDNRNSM